MENKILLSTDWHFGKSNGRFDKIIMEGVRQQCDYAKLNGIKIFCHLGDVLDVKQSISTSTLNYLADAFKMVSETFEKIYVIVGNHDLSKKTTKEGHNLKILNWFENIEIIDKEKIIEIYDKTIFMLPYKHHELLNNEIFEKADYMMGHIEVKGFMYNQFVQVEEGIEVENIKNIYKEIFLGHFHKKQSIGNIHYIGNLCRFFYGENDDPRGWTILDVESGKTEFIEYKHPRMFKIKVTELENMDLKEVFEAGDNLKLVIDKNLKYSELEKLKSKIIIEGGINELVLDDQYYAFDLDDLDDEDDDEPNEVKQEPTFIEFLIQEIKKINKEIPKSVIDYFEEKSEEFRE
jgi:DNA repair exonuclease SbcCD nuclease subunit